MRLAFFGSGAFGLPTLQHLAQRHSLSCIITQPDKTAGRGWGGSKLSPTPIGQWAAANLPSVPILKPEKVNDPEVTRCIREFPADAWVVIAFGQKLSRALLDGRFAINLHASLLPRWRGAAPINAAILAGDSETGNTVITLADRMDAGLILGATRRRIDPLSTAGELHDILAADGPNLVEAVLAGHAEGTSTPHAQDESLVTIATKLGKHDDTVDFTQKADFVRRQVHAITPWPGVTSAILPPDSGAESADNPPAPLMVIKIRRVQPVIGTHQDDPGTILDPATGTVACGQHTRLRLLEVQPPGRNIMRWEDFFRGAGREIPTRARLVPARDMA